jgi:HK97 family phage major capsid protein
VAPKRLQQHQTVEIRKLVASMTHEERSTPENRAILGASETVPSDGGWMVGTDDLGMIRKKMLETGQVLSRVDRRQIGSGFNGVKWLGIDETTRVDGSRSGGVQAFWAAEAETVTAKKPKMKKHSLDAEKLMAIYYATEELMEDAVALEAFALPEFTKELLFKAEDAIINGDGAGKPLGILNAAAKVAVAKETGQKAATIIQPNISKMWSRLHAPSRVNAVWYINQDIEPQLDELAVVVGTGGVPIYLPAGGLSGSPFATLKGRPVIPIEYCPTLGTEGDIQLTDMSEYMFIEKGAIKQASSAHVQFLTDQTAWRFTWRLNGQSKWHSPLTPFKGTKTQSPIITLAVRA